MFLPFMFLTPKRLRHETSHDLQISIGVKCRKDEGGPASSLSSMEYLLQIDRGAERSRVERGQTQRMLSKVGAESKAASVRVGLEERVMRPEKALFYGIMIRSYLCLANDSSRDVRHRSIILLYYIVYWGFSLW